MGRGRRHRPSSKDGRAHKRLRLPNQTNQARDTRYCATPRHVYREECTTKQPRTNVSTHEKKRGYVIERRWLSLHFSGSVLSVGVTFLARAAFSCRLFHESKEPATFAEEIRKEKGQSSGLGGDLGWSLALRSYDGSSDIQQHTPVWPAIIGILSSLRVLLSSTPTLTTANSHE